MKLGIIGPTEGEINSVINQIDNKKTTQRALLNFIEGTLCDIDVVAVFCGVCKVNAATATQIIIDTFGATHIVNIGVAGAVDETLQICDTIISSQVTYHDVADDILTEYHPWMKEIYFHADAKMICDIIKANFDDPTVYVGKGKIVTGESFITKLGRSEIKTKYLPLCVDMETAIIAHVCYVNQIPFVAIRSISDTPNESGNEAFEKYYQKASDKATNIFLQYIRLM